MQIGGELRGLVVLPPPPPRGPFSEVGRLLSLPGTLVLFTAAAAVGAVIFVPLRRRLRGLEAAAARIGAGEFAVRADDAGHDEIAGLAGAFNRMSAELAARDRRARVNPTACAARCSPTCRTNCGRRSPRCAAISTRWPWPT